MKNETKSLTAIFSEFEKLLKESVGKMYKACCLYVKTIDANPEMRNKFREKYPEISSYNWKMFESVGRRNMDERLLTMSGYGPMAVGKLPYSEQKNVLNDPYIDFLPGINHKDSESIRVPINELNINQVRQVFDGAHIRTVQEQRIWLKRQPIIEKPKISISDKYPFKIIQKNGMPVEIQVNKPCTIKFDEIMKLAYAR